MDAMYVCMNVGALQFIYDTSYFDHIQGILGFSDIAQVRLHMDTSHLDITHSKNRRIPNHTSRVVYDTSHLDVTHSENRRIPIIQVALYMM